MEGFVDWPDDEKSRYRRLGYWKNVALGEALEAAATANADRIALVDGARRFTYAELFRRSRRLASSLARRGICDGAPVIFQLPNIAEIVVAYLACLKVGALPVACLPHHREAEIGSIARLVDATAWLFSPSYRGFDHAAMARGLKGEISSMQHLISMAPAGGTTTFQELLDAGDEHDPALSAHIPDPGGPVVFQLSGGTTGIPKVIARTHNDYLLACTMVARASSVTRDDVMLITIPAAHNFPLVMLQGAFLLGARVVLAPSAAAEKVLPLIEHERVTWIPAVPATLIRWTQVAVETGGDFSSLKSIAVGGQRLNAEPARAAIDVFGAVIRQNFGMTEGFAACTRDTDPIDVHLETQGRAVGDYDDLLIVDEDGNPVPEGEVGEFLVRGPATIRGYYRAPDHNASAFTPDGYYRSGDMVRRLPNGNFVVDGRKKDLINRGGEKISAEEIENLILKHDAVANAAVVSIPDPVLGERVCACVTLHPGANLSLGELVSFLAKEQIAAIKMPERLETFDALPASGVGKIAKNELRRLVEHRLAAANR